MTQALSITLSGRALAVPAEYVREVIRAPREMTRVPLAAPAVLGLFNLHGRIVLGLSLSPHLGLAAAAQGRNLCLVIEYKEELYGLAVDAAGGVLSLDRPAEDADAFSVLDIPGLIDGLSRAAPEQE